MCTFVPNFANECKILLFFRCFIKQDERNYKDHSIA